MDVVLFALGVALVFAGGATMFALMPFVFLGLLISLLGLGVATIAAIQMHKEREADD